jgi:hypothetical protein
MRKSLVVYHYHPVPENLPESKHKATFIDGLDARIEDLWTPEIRELMQPIGHPSSKRFFIQQFKAAQLIKAGANEKGWATIAKTDDWALMTALRRVAHRRGIAPTQLLMSMRAAAE